MTVNFTNEELGTLRRLLKHELHEDLQLENKQENIKAPAWRDQHEFLVSYKMSLLKKLGSKATRQELKIYDMW